MNRNRHLLIGTMAVTLCLASLGGAHAATIPVAMIPVATCFGRIAYFMFSSSWIRLRRLRFCVTALTGTVMLKHNSRECHIQRKKTGVRV